MDTHFNIIMLEKNNNFVVFKGKKIYIRDGDVKSIRKIQIKSN